MAYVKILSNILNSQANILTIKGEAPFAKTFSKIIKSKNIDFVWIQKALPAQMAAVVVTRLAGRKFLWIQSFSNPPEPSFITRLLLNQADEILVKSRAMAAKMKKFGVDKPRIKLLR